MTTSRTGHTATLLSNGKVLITGGSGDISAELYDPDTGTFTLTGNLTTPRWFPSATLLADGRVLIVGGDVADRMPTKNSAEIYDPNTGTFKKTGGTVTDQIGGRATLLNSGRVLIAGGATDFLLNTPLANPELYDPSTGTFNATGAFAIMGRTAFDNNGGGPPISAVSLLSDGKVLIAEEPTSELYDPATGTFSLTSPMVTPCIVYISGRTATLLQNGQLLFTGGESGDGDCAWIAKAELYGALTATFTATGNMTRRRVDHTATLLPDGTVLIAGGRSADCTNQGCSFIGSVNTAELYDPSTGIFAITSDMTAYRTGHAATLLNNGQVLITGGTCPACVQAPTAELYVPSPLILPLVVTDLRFDVTTVAAGTSYSAKVSGSNLTDRTFFDVRFTAPGSNSYIVALNWQRGLTATHSVPAGMASGIWTITGVRAHEIETDHTGNFVPVSATITVSP
jgi:WD40 repeat protein